MVEASNIAASRRDDPLKIFICWSGDYSKEIAKEVSTFFNDAFDPDVEVFFSEDNIKGGARWQQYLSGELQNADVGLLCLTPDNLNSSWIHYEAGALSKLVDHSLVIPLLFGVSHADLSKSPLVFFQAVTADSEKDVLQIVLDINNRLKNRSRREKLLEKRVKENWKKVTNTSKSLLVDVELQDDHATGGADGQIPVMDEMLALVRQIRQEIAPLGKMRSKLDQLQNQVQELNSDWEKERSEKRKSAR